MERSPTYPVRGSAKKAQLSELKVHAAAHLLAGVDGIQEPGQLWLDQSTCCHVHFQVGGKQYGSEEVWLHVEPNGQAAAETKL